MTDLPPIYGSLVTKKRICLRLNHIDPGREERADEIRSNGETKPSNFLHGSSGELSQQACMLCG